MFGRYRHDDDVEFWAEAERTRIQTRVDCASFYFSIVVMLFGAVVYILWPFCEVVIEKHAIQMRKAQANGHSRRPTDGTILKFRWILGADKARSDSDQRWLKRWSGP